MKSTISIITPVYNAESTLGRMLDSVKAQSYKDWELVAVNDGSSDNSGEILDRYAADDLRIRVIHKKNAGVAAARQDGIDLAQGKYTIHADADDWIESDMLEKMLDVAERDNADIVIADFYTDINGKSTFSKQSLSSTESEDVLYGLYDKKLFGSLWHKLIKRNVYEKAQARFIEGINYCEDLLLLTQILTRTSPRISYIPKAFYHYVLNDNSLTQLVTLKGLESMRRFHEEARKMLPCDERFEAVKKSFVKNEFLVYFMNRLYPDTKHLKAEYRKISDVLNAYSPLRWRVGYKCISLGLIPLAHRLIKF